MRGRNVGRIGISLISPAAWNQDRMKIQRGKNICQLHSSRARNTLTLLVVAPSRSGMYQTPGDSRNKQGIGDFELDSVVQGRLGLFKHGIELGGLGNSSGEAVEDEAEGRSGRIRGERGMSGVGFNDGR